MDVAVRIEAEFYGRHVGLRTGLAPGVRFRFRDEAGRTKTQLELSPVPTGARLLLHDLGLALGVGVVANLVRSEASVSSVTVQPSGPVHPAWASIIGLYAELAEVPTRLHATFSENVRRPAAKGRVFLCSGGKDTLFALRQAQASGEARGRPAIYLGAGAEINWFKEYSQVQRVAQHFGLRLRHVELRQAVVSSKVALRFANRASWREFVTLTLARCYGSVITTGINDDQISQLEMRVPGMEAYLSQLAPSVRAMEAILAATVETVPGEFEVYGRMRGDALFNRAGSCLSECERDPVPCAKCRTFGVYDQILDCGSPTKEDVNFMHSGNYIGDASLLDAFPSRSCDPS